MFAYRNKELSPYVLEMERIMLVYLYREFNSLHLSGNLLERGTKISDKGLTVAPRNYDTAHFIRTQRKTGIGDIRTRAGSYADELNKLGSEFEVFKKPATLSPNLKKRTIQNISEKNLERVIVRPHNHIKYLEYTISDSVKTFQKLYKDKVVGVKIWLKS